MGDTLERAARMRLMPDRFEDRIAGASGPPEQVQGWAERHFGRPFHFDEGASPLERAAAIRAVAGTMEQASEAGAKLPARMVFKPEASGLRDPLDANGRQSLFGRFLLSPSTWLSRTYAAAGLPANRPDSAASVWVNTDALRDDPNRAAQATRHELGHVNHGTLGKAPALSDADRAIARRVSPYATTNGREFVAETFANVTNGQKYDDEVMDLYRRLGGPPAARW